MATASAKALAKQLLEIEKKIAPDLLKADGIKEKLRDVCAKKGASFTEEIDGLGSVEVKAGTEKKFKGNMPELQPEAFQALPAKQRKQLETSGLVTIVALWSKPSKPSVTVRL